MLMDVMPRLRQTELLVTGLFHCAGVLLDRLVENGLIERVEIDAALQSVEDSSFADQYMEIYPDEESRRWLAMPARILRVINELGGNGRVMKTDELREILNFKQEF